MAECAGVPKLDDTSHSQSMYIVILVNSGNCNIDDNGGYSLMAQSSIVRHWHIPYDREEYHHGSWSQQAAGGERLPSAPVPQLKSVFTKLGGNKFGDRLNSSLKTQLPLLKKISVRN